MTKKTPFSDIAYSKNKANKKDEFINSAKVDGRVLPNKDRRGSSYIDKKTGERVALKGKIIQIPVNEEELTLLENAARSMGLNLATFIRVAGLEKVKHTH